MALAHHASWLGVRKAHRTTPGIASDENALSAAQRESVRDLLWDIPINAEGLIEFCNLGWLDPEQLRDRRAAADAVIELTNAAIAPAAQHVRLKTWPTLHRQPGQVQIGGTDYRSRDAAIIAPLH